MITPLHGPGSLVWVAAAGVSLSLLVKLEAIDDNRSWRNLGVGVSRQGRSVNIDTIVAVPPAS